MSDRNRMESLDAGAPVNLSPYPPVSVAMHRQARIVHEALLRQERVAAAGERRFMRWYAVIVLAVAAVAILTGCSKAVTSGTVTGKEYHPAYESSYMICAAYIKAQCSVWMPVFDHHKQEWVLDLRGDDNSTGTVTVSDATYRSISVGDYYRGNS